MDINLEIIKEILKRKSHLSDRFEKYGKIYLNTTENISGILSGIDVNSKNVLSVAGSGDQALNAFYNGAKSVTLFDINPLAFAQSELKFTAAKKLSYKEFCGFFIPDTGKTLDPKTFNKLSNYLNEDVASYYDYLFSNFSPAEIFIKTVQPFIPRINKLEHVNDYMGEDNFKKMASILEDKEIKYVESNIWELPTKLESMFDTILLSNISDSIEVIWNINTLKHYKRFIHILSGYLNKGGVIQCGYIYTNYENKERLPIFANNNERRKVFTEDEFRERKIESYEFYSSTDTVVTFEKKRRKAA